MALRNVYGCLEQLDTQLLEHNGTYFKLKQRIVDLNNRVKMYEGIVRKVELLKNTIN